MGVFVGHTPVTAGTFPKKFWKNSGKTPETLSECFLEFPSRARPSRAFPEISPPPSTAGGFFQKWFRRGPLSAGRGMPSNTEGTSECFLAAAQLFGSFDKRVHIDLPAPFPSFALQQETPPLTTHLNLTPTPTQGH